MTLDVYGLSYAFVLSFCLPKLDASVPFCVICYSQPINYLSLPTTGKGLEMYWLYQSSFNNCCVTIFENSFAKCCERMYNNHHNTEYLQNCGAVNLLVERGNTWLGSWAVFFRVHLNGGILLTLSLKFSSLQSDYMQAFLKKDIII